MQKKKSTIFLKLLMVLVFIFMALAYYAYKLIQEDKAKHQNKEPTATVVVLPSVPTPMAHPTLTVREKNRTEVSTPVEPVEIVEKNRTEALSLDPFSQEFIPPVDEVYVEENNTVIEDVPQEEIPINVDLPTQEVVEPKPVYKHSDPMKLKDTFSRMAIKGFLDKFAIALSTGSVDSILYYYDTYVERYFLLNGVTHREIRTQRERFNSRWEHRDFRFKNFVILRMYEKEGMAYCNIAYTIKWSVSSENGGADFGKNRGSIRLKKTLNGFKIVSIYSKN